MVISTEKSTTSAGEDVEESNFLTLANSAEPGPGTPHLGLKRGEMETHVHAHECSCKSHSQWLDGENNPCFHQPMTGQQQTGCHPKEYYLVKKAMKSEIHYAID